jgi:DNA-binding beta-propeller fold protein YncE
MFVLNRRPPSVQTYDTSLDQTGFPKNRAIAAVDVCRGASSLAVGNVGDGERAFVACFGDGTVNVVDPRAGSTLTDVITVGRGPFAIAVSSMRRKLYVSNFLEDTIGVVDLAPESPFNNRVVLRIGERRQ